MAQFRRIPTFTQQWTAGTTNDGAWYRYFQQADSGTPPSEEIPQTFTASPASLSAPSKGVYLITGGTVSAIMLSRTPGVFLLTGMTSGFVPVAQNDVVKITYSSKPTVNFIPS